MDDIDIIDQFRERSETAITALSEKYSKYCRVIAMNILGNIEDAEEVLNDTYNRVWNAIPPERPNNLRAFVGKTTRNLALDKFEKSKAKKRGGGQLNAILSELEECITDSRNLYDDLAESEAITNAVNVFLSELNAYDRHIFITRYWMADSIKSIAKTMRMSEGNVKTSLCRLRVKLRKHLENEDVTI